MQPELIEQYYIKCIQLAKKIKNPALRKACLEIYKDYKHELTSRSATFEAHHFYLGGLIYHTYCVTRNALVISLLYPNIKVDKDLVIFGGLLHDIGKIKTYETYRGLHTDDNLNLSKDLLGHSYLGTHIVENYLDKQNIPPDIKNQALHMIASHMNEFGDGNALVTPKMLEVVILNYADGIDAYLEPAQEELDRVEPGETYKVCNAPREYYKSLNKYENKMSYEDLLKILEDN